MTNQQFKTRLLEIFIDFDGSTLPATSSTMFSELTNRYEIFHPSYHDEMINSKILDYFRNRLLRHKNDVYNAGKELALTYGVLDLMKMDCLDQFQRNLIFHDLSKFSVTEALPYSTHDFSNSHSKGTPEFQYAWCHHKAVNPHHPEHWYNPTRSGKLNVLPMQDIYIVEMLADWIGAGRTWGNELETWLPDNLHTFVFHDETMEKLKMILEHLHYEVEKKEGKLFTTGLKR